MKTLLLLFLTLPAAASPGSPDRRDANGNVLNPVVELANPQGQRVLIVGMNHLGFPSFYSSVRKLVEAWAARQPNRAVILREFFTCSGAVYAFSERAVTNQDILDLAPKAPALDDPAVVAQYGEAQAAPLIDAFHLTRQACVLDVDGKTHRPIYYVQRNQDWCAQASAHGGACQFRDLQIPDSAKIQNKEADLALDGAPAGLQFMGALAFKANYGPDVDGSQPIFPRLYGLVERMIIDYRTNLLVEKTMAELAAGHDRIVIPWGAAHVRPLYQSLLARGFKQVGHGDVLYYQPSDAGKWDMIDREVNDPNYPVTDHYDYQDP